MPFISYAQNYEDVMLWRALGNVERGFYVDVGAADPEEHSVTRAFYEHGWSGINVEPLDEYFQKLDQARPRDTNLQVAVGCETGLRTLHAFAGTGLSTLDSKISALHKAAGFQAHEILVPVLTLAKILEDCAPPTIHFLKIDVEGAEAEVLEGLNLDRARPWIIVIEATKPPSKGNSRDPWEHLLTNHGYSFTYFDGVNCFYVSDEMSGLKERLTVPPNCSDDCVRWSEWSNGQKVATLEQELASIRADAQRLGAVLGDATNHAEGLEKLLEKTRTESGYLRNGLQAEKNYATYLHGVLQTQRAQIANLHHALLAEQGQVANLSNALQLEQAQVAKLEVQLALPSVDRALGRAARRLHEMGDRLTGGGVRALANRMFTASLRRFLSIAARHPRMAAVPRGMLKPFPRLATALTRVATQPDPLVTTSSGADVESFALEGELQPSEDPIVAALPALARATYLRLQTAMSKGGYSRHVP
jgi:FkbM family methyltransferase